MLSAAAESHEVLRIPLLLLLCTHRHVEDQLLDLGTFFLISADVNIQMDGDGRRLKGAIQRSTETGLAVEMPSRTVRQASHESIEDSMNSYGSEGK
ncbi:regulating synaptic membrane exocytosis protein hypothetical protein [Limosa lapponica baueri]|uniref:Uncharacterized protein n=1 Tax=Limosa lapponica baueri TaxID=1758121 RepID=A0A2I0T8N9_LIMLA|nr:regulating synaptic membrane exocytosis protein hypothetical protein [Limosa lapponica baueri]